MKLTRKCKEDFEKWFNNHEEYKCGFGCYDEDYVGATDFKDLPQSMKYGVYVDFFDSVGLKIEIGLYQAEKSEIVDYEIFINYKCLNSLKTRQEAREKVIIKANEIYNESTKETN